MELELLTAEAVEEFIANGEIIDGDDIVLFEEGITSPIEGVEEPMEYDLDRDEVDLDDLDDISGGMNPIQGAVAAAAIVLGTTFASVPTTTFAAQASHVQTTSVSTNTSASRSAINPGSDGGSVALASSSVSAKSHSFTVQATKMTVKAGASVYLRSKPWVNDGSVIKGSINAGQKVQITGIVLKGGRVADWYRVNVGGKTLYVSKSYMKPQVISGETNKKQTTTPGKQNVASKKKMTVTGVSNYLGIRTQQTTDWRFEIGQLHNGDVVQVLDTSNPTFYKIYSPSTGITGYVVARFLK